MSENVKDFEETRITFRLSLKVATMNTFLKAKIRLLFEVYHLARAKEPGTQFQDVFSQKSLYKNILTQI